MIYNLTSHTINFASRYENILQIPPSGLFARIHLKSRRENQIGPIPTYSCDVTGVANLPEENGEDQYIVSSLVAMLVPDRDDVFCPTRPYLTTDGTYACKGVRRFQV